LSSFRDVPIDGAWIGKWIYWTLIYIALGTTSNYSATANLHILQITTASAEHISSLQCLRQPFPSSGYFSMALPAHSGPRPLTQFRNHFFTDGRTPWTSDQPVARPLPKHRTKQTQNKCIHTTNIHALSVIRTHDPSLRASEDNSYLRPRGYRDRLYKSYFIVKILEWILMFGYVTWMGLTI
jgi:hypothetical protein